MKAFKYSLDKSSKKFLCPSCDKKTFVRFKNIEGQFVDEKFGRCDREVNCGYFLKPEEDKPVFIPRQRVEYKPPSFVPVDLVNKTLTNYESNNLSLYLLELMGESRFIDLVEDYKFGVDDTSEYTSNWTIFWQIDSRTRVRSGKLIRYLENGHRDKGSLMTWFHTKRNIHGDMFPDFNFKQCLFGEHLLGKYPKKPVAIVESEKTALICSFFFEKYVWLSCGGKTQLTRDKTSVVKNRSVTLFPDLGAYDDWHQKATEFGFNISDRIEKIATDEDRNNGLDLADFLLRDTL